MLNDVEFREVQEVAKVDRVKIVACDGKSKCIIIRDKPAKFILIRYNFSCLIMKIL